jgi:ariadne-1
MDEWMRTVISAMTVRSCFSFTHSLLTSTVSDFEDVEVNDDEEGFDSQDKNPKSQQFSFEVDHRSFSPKDIDAAQVKLIREVKDVLGQPPESTAILLRYFRWNREKLIEQYMEDQADVLEAAGLGADASSAAKLTVIPGFECEICYCNEPDVPTFALKCNDRFCVDCYRQYVEGKVKNEGEAARIKCPGEKCNRIIDSKSLGLLLSENLKDR